MRNLILSCVVAMGIGTAAAAAEPSDWVKCDGLAKSEGIGTTAARIGAVVFSMGLLGLPEESRASPAARGQGGVDACTAVLERPELEPYWARKVSLTRARALHHVEAGNPEMALADLEATKAAAAGHTTEAYFARSAGIAVSLLQAAILAKQGDQAQAETMAGAAAEARPYSLQVQTLAAAIYAIDPAWSRAEDRVLTRRAAAEPDTLAARAAAREWGDPAGAADDWAAYAEDMARLEAVPRHAEKIGIPRDRMAGSAIRYPAPLARAAVAAARAGRPDQARTQIAALKALKPWAPEKPRGGRGGAEDTRIAEASAKSIELARQRIPLAEAYLLLSEGKAAEAAATLESIQKLPAEPAALDLIRRVRAANPGRLVLDNYPIDLVEKRLSDTLKAERTSKLDLVFYAQNLPPLESQGRKSPYAAQPPFGMRGGKGGWLDRDNKAGGWTVEFLHTGSRASTEEMMLLRAAQLARERGQSGFLITKRGDYERYYVTTMYGAETSRMPNGHQMEADVVFTGASLAPPQAWSGRQDLVLDAEKVWADLSPYYLYQPLVATN